MPTGHSKNPEETSRKLREAMKRRNTFGERHPGWKGGRIKANNEGYMMIYAPDHSNHNSSGYVLEHRLLMEEKLGRYLTKKEVVHHMNGVKNDNRIENLSLFKSNKEHLKEETKNGIYAKTSEWRAAISRATKGRQAWNKGLKLVAAEWMPKDKILTVSQPDEQGKQQIFVHTIKPD